MTAFAQMTAVSLESWRELRNYEHKIESSLASRFEQQTRKVVHEARNPLAIIKNYLKIISQRLPEENVVRQELDILKEEIDRVSRILSRMNDLSVQAPALDRVDVNGVIKGMLALYGESLFSGSGISVEMTLDPQLTPMPCDRDKLKQILLNLWKNAAEALPPGSRLITETADNLYREGRSYTQLSVTDNGPGLPADVMGTLFQPLGLHRRPGRSGLGLSIVHQLVSGLGGQISCQTAAGRGTNFVVLLPQAESAAVATGGER
jgi:nitrogen-specific signal transduction histidine kinase